MGGRRRGWQGLAHRPVDASGSPTRSTSRAARRRSPSPRARCGRRRVASPASHRGGTLRVAMVKRFFGCCYGPAIPYGTSVAPARSTTASSPTGGPAARLREAGRRSRDRRSRAEPRRPVVRLQAAFRHPVLRRLARPAGGLPRLARSTSSAAARRLRASLYANVVGAPRCAVGRERCDLSDGIETDARSGTITIHLTEPDCEFLHKLAAPLRLRRARRPPYRAARCRRRERGRTGSRATARRQERGWCATRTSRCGRQDARPDGFPDEIVVRVWADRRRPGRRRQARGVGRHGGLGDVRGPAQPRQRPRAAPRATPGSCTPTRPRTSRTCS